MWTLLFLTERKSIYWKWFTSSFLRWYGNNQVQTLLPLEIKESVDADFQCVSEFRYIYIVSRSK